MLYNANQDDSYSVRRKLLKILTQKIMVTKRSKGRRIADRLLAGVMGILGILCFIEAYRLWQDGKCMDTSHSRKGYLHLVEF